MDSPNIEVLVKRIYGKERFYPISEDAKMICTLMKCTTLTKESLKMCRDHGWNVSVKTEEYQLE